MRGFERDDDGTWLVHYVAHDPGNPAPTKSLPESTIRCAKLILAAGTFGSTYLLLRNRMSLPGISPALGTRFCGNGDLLGLMLNATQMAQGTVSSRPLVGSRGPVITTAIRVGDELDGDGSSGRGYYIEDAGYPGFMNWLMELSQIRAAIPRVARMAARIVENRLFQQNRSNISADLAAAMGASAFSESSVPLLGMGRDVPDGMMNLRDGRLAIDWTVATSEEYFARVRGTMAALAETLGAGFQDNPLWWAKRVITVHPLGGAPIGATIQAGVCDPYSQVYEAPGLYVVDGSAMPGPVGANPSLTIAALADRACERMLTDVWPQPHHGTAAPASTFLDARHVVPSLAEAAQPGTRVAFTEQMKGHFTLGEGAPFKANDVALLRHERMMFELTITTTGIDDFLGNPAHPGSATGYLDGDLLGGRCEVEQGWFNLFVRGPGSGHKLMLYRLHVSSPGGRPLTFVGVKDIHDDPGFDVWADTTTLRVQVLRGHLSQLSDTGLLPPEDSRILGAGILYIHPLDFAKQLTTFTTIGPDGAGAMAKFGELFLGSLWDSFSGIAKATP
ncbi:GMC family oxidoreductase [Arthrobacter psychrolactophilus]